MYELTCAHKTLPLGTMVIVTNLDNGQSLELRVNDRGPFVKERIIDLSYAAAQILGIWEKGTAYVKVEGFGPRIEEIQRFTVQVGSFIDEVKAQNLADQLRKGFENVYVNTVETFSQKYHRVRVGLFETKEPALNIAPRFFIRLLHAPALAGVISKCTWFVLRQYACTAHSNVAASSRNCTR